jgi:hypothetical protein
MKLIRDVDLQLEEETLNPHLQIVPYQHEILDVFHESFEFSFIQEANLDDHIMLKNLSPKHSESFKENEEECLEDTIVKYHSSRYSFHVLIYDSFYSLYPDLFLDSGGFDTLPMVSYSFPPHSNLFDMPKFGEANSKHNTYQVDLMLFHFHHSNGKMTCCKMILHDLFLKKTMHSSLWRSNILHCIFIL